MLICVKTCSVCFNCFKTRLIPPLVNRLPYQFPGHFAFLFFFFPVTRLQPHRHYNNRLMIFRSKTLTFIYAYVLTFSLIQSQSTKQSKWLLFLIHTLCVLSAHAAANLNSRYSKYAKVALVHYICKILLWTPWA